MSEEINTSMAPLGHKPFWVRCVCEDPECGAWFNSNAEPVLGIDQHFIAGQRIRCNHLSGASLEFIVREVSGSRIHVNAMDGPGTIVELSGNLRPLKIEIISWPGRIIEHPENARHEFPSGASFGEQLDSALKQHIYTVLNAHKNGAPVPEVIDYWTGSFGELMEQIAIEHIRAWHLEDAAGEAMKRGDKDALFEVKRKLDICWKIRRPRLVTSVNRRLDDALAHGKSAVEDSVKLYKGYDTTPNA